LFYGVEEFAADLQAGQVGGRYTPFEVAEWLRDLSDKASKQLFGALRSASANDADARRWVIDVSIQSGLGQFFAHKLRAGTLYAMHQQGGSRTALAEAIKEYHAARRAWIDLARQVRDVYAADVTFGHEPQQRGHWSDRVAAIDADIATLENLAAHLGDRAADGAELVIGAPKRPQVACQHTPPPKFHPGDAVAIALSIPEADASAMAKSVRLHYRHVNQAEAWQTAMLQSRAGSWQIEIPAAYTKSEFPLQYFFELRNAAGAAWRYPGFEPNLCNQPYFVIRQG
jgi:hypothetical protein